MLIAGLQKLSLIDYPGKVAATVFTAGCNLSCPFCHNPSLVKVSPDPPLITEASFFDWLSARAGFLEGVCVTGGEPTIQPDLLDFLKRIRDLGFLVKLDTNGTNPPTLKELNRCGLIDYLAMDIKAPLEKYDLATRSAPHVDAIDESVGLAKTFPDYEFRTTVVPLLLNRGDFLAIGQWLKGSKKYVLQQFRPENTLDAEFSKVEPYSKEELEEFCELVAPFFEKVELRV